MTFKYNDTIVNKQGEKRRVLGVCDEVVFISDKNNHYAASIWSTHKELKNEGWTVVEDEYIPEIGSVYFFLAGSRKPNNCYWDDDNIDKFRLKTKNIFRTKKQAEARYKEIME